SKESKHGSSSLPSFRIGTTTETKGHCGEDATVLSSRIGPRVHSLAFAELRTITCAILLSHGRR
ncbi:MAG: hypothetical protein ACRD4H_10410, partial [Candidatus Acidiferrales bacterium]